MSGRSCARAGQPGAVQRAQGQSDLWRERVFLACAVLPRWAVHCRWLGSKLAQGFVNSSRVGLLALQAILRPGAVQRGTRGLAGCTRRLPHIFL